MILLKSLIQELLNWQFPNISLYLLLSNSINITPVQYSKNVATNETEFQRSFERVPWWVANIFDEIDDVTYCFQTFYNNIIKEQVKTRKAKVKTKSLQCVNGDVRKIMNKRYRALLNWQKDKSNCALKRKYQDLRNQDRKELHIAEATYWKDHFKKAHTNKYFWNFLIK